MENIRKLEKEEWILRNGSLESLGQRPTPPDRKVALDWLKADRPASVLRLLGRYVLAYMQKGNSQAVAEGLVLGDVARLLKGRRKP